MSQGFINDNFTALGSTGNGLYVKQDQPTVNQPITMGVTDGSNAGAGEVGEYISSSVLIGSAVSLTSLAITNITSISLTAGDWDVSGTVAFVGPATVTATISAISSISSTFETIGSSNNINNENQTGFAGYSCNRPVGPRRYSLSSTTTIYLIGQANFSVSTYSAYGFIGARRVR